MAPAKLHTTRKQVFIICERPLRAGNLNELNDPNRFNFIAYVDFLFDYLLDTEDCRYKSKTHFLLHNLHISHNCQYTET